MLFLSFLCVFSVALYWCSESCSFAGIHYIWCVCRCCCCCCLTRCSLHFFLLSYDFSLVDDIFIFFLFSMSFNLVHLHFNAPTSILVWFPPFLFISFSFSFLLFILYPRYFLATLFCSCSIQCTLYFLYLVRFSPSVQCSFVCKLGLSCREKQTNKTKACRTNVR